LKSEGTREFHVELVASGIREAIPAVYVELVLLACASKTAIEYAIVIMIAGKN